MKVLMTTDNIGGVLTFAVDLAKGLASQGIEVVMAITGEVLTSRQKEELAGISYYFGRFKQEWMEDPWKDIRLAGRWLMEIQQMVKPDLIHLNACSFGDLGWSAPTVTTIHSDVLSWWQAVKNEPAPADWNNYRNRVQKGLQAVDFITSPTRAMMKAAEKYYGPFKRKKVIYNGRDSESFFTAPKEKFVFSMGRLWDEAKNANLLLKAAPEINYPLYIAGDNAAVDRRNIPENVHLTGQLSTTEISAYLAGAGVYALPVKYEPFGYTFVEAAFSGCALVGGDIDSLHEVWDDAMMYVDPADPALLAARINLLLADEETFNQFATKAYNRAYLNYRIGAMTDAYAALFNNLCGGKSKSITNKNINTSAI